LRFSARKCPLARGVARDLLRKAAPPPQRATSPEPARRAAVRPNDPSDRVATQTSPTADQLGRDCARLSDDLRVVGCSARSGHRPTRRYQTCMFIHRRSWGEYPLLPPTGLPGLPWCAGVPVRRACRTGTVLLAVELIEGHGAGGEREPGRDARMPPGSGTGLRDGRAAGRVPAVPGRSGAGRRTPARNHRVGRGSGSGPTPVNVAVEPAGAVPGRLGSAAVRCVAPGRAVTLSDT
jgi:hypothetical protein